MSGRRIAETVTEDVTVDPATGLPVLPEHLFWRIREVPLYKDSYNTYPSRVDDGELCVEICTNDTKTESTTEEKVLPRTWRNLWKSETVEVEKTVEVPVIKVLGMERMIEVISCDREKRDEMVEKGWIYSKNQSWSSFSLSYENDNRNFVRLLEPTAENALKTATSVLKKYWVKMEKERQERVLEEGRQKLAGVYPPKTLADLSPSLPFNDSPAKNLGESK